MALFRYQALKDSGERVEGTIEGADRSLVMSRLSAQGLHPIEVREQGAESAGGSALGLSPNRVKGEEVTIFTRQLAWLLDAGTTLNRALDILARESFSARFSAVLAALQSDIRKGKSFRDALAASGVFPPFYLSMVEVGEATGTLAAVLDRLAGARERDQKTRGKVISALTYPMLLVVLSIGVVIFLMVSVVPGIKDMIVGSGAPIPDSARLVIGASDWLIANGRLLAIALALGALGLALLWQRSAPAAAAARYGAQAAGRRLDPDEGGGGAVLPHPGGAHRRGHDASGEPQAHRRQRSSTAASPTRPGRWKRRCAGARTSWRRSRPRASSRRCSRAC